MTSDWPKWFHLVVPEPVVRSMTRTEYYEMRSWVRHCERIMAQHVHRASIEVRSQVIYDPLSNL